MEQVTHIGQPHLGDQVHGDLHGGFGTADLPPFTLRQGRRTHVGGIIAPLLLEQRQTQHADHAEDADGQEDHAPRPETAQVRADRNAERQREAMGAVNLRAEEDAKAVEAEFDNLAAEKSDLEEAVKKLPGKDLVIG